jgi:hypothetical protein
MSDGDVEGEKWRIENSWVCLWLRLYVDGRRKTSVLYITIYHLYPDGACIITYG